MRFRPRFPLRTLLIAILLVGVVLCIVENNFLYERKVVFVDRRLQGRYVHAAAYIEEYKFLPRIRLRATVLFSWGVGAIGLNGNDGPVFAIPSSDWRVHRGRLAVTHKGETLKGISEIVFPISAVGRVYNAPFVPELRGTKSKVSWAGFLGYANDPAIQEWSVDALETWIRVH